MNSSLPVYVAEDAADLARRAAGIFGELARAAVASRGRFTVALSGGSTPRAMYDVLSESHEAASRAASTESLFVPWHAVHIFFGDERYVPHDDPQSNFRMAREALLSRVPIPPAQVHPMPTDEKDPAVAAARYEETLHAEFRVPAGSWPQFDLVLLGLGDDGHTASLFPSTAAVHERTRWVLAPWVEKFSTHRLTLTPPVLCAAREILFLVSGAGKAEILHAVLEGPHDPDRYPCQIVQPTSGRLRWLVDRPAAVRLTRQTHRLS